LYLTPTNVAITGGLSEHVYPQGRAFLGVNAGNSSVGQVTEN